jgi:hypothetical protein
MKTKMTARILLIILVLALAAISCIGGGGGGGDGNNGDAGRTEETISADVTATYGAEQFHIQLTAIAEQSQKAQP